MNRTADQLPPGPRAPAAWQMLVSWLRPTVSLDRARERYGTRFTVRIFGQPPVVVLSDHQEIKELFQTPPDVVHCGEPSRLLEPIMGPNAVGLLDEDAHLEQRRLMLPAFHGERMKGLEGVMTELAEREIDSWPHDEPIELHSRLQGLMLEIVLRAVFGVEQGMRLGRLRDLLIDLLAFTESPLSVMPFAQRALAGRGPMARMERAREETDRLIYELIDERRRAGTDGPDVLAMLLDATHEDGTPMTPQEMRDDLVNALVAGHETTASQLTWIFETLAHEPAVAGRIAEEIDGAAGDAYLTATIHEIMRLRPVIPHAEPRLVKQPLEIGGIAYPPGVVLIPSIYLVQRDPNLYPDPLAFRPERFLEQSPGTYTWIAFGGGRRRCLGASFAMLEMKVVLRCALSRSHVLPGGSTRERPRWRSITLSPSRGGLVTLRARRASRDATAEPPAAVTAAP